MGIVDFLLCCFPNKRKVKKEFRRVHQRFDMVEHQINDIGLALIRIEDWLKSADQAQSIEFLLEIDGGQIIGGRQVFLQPEKHLKVKVTAIKDKFGNSAKVDGVPKYAMTDETLGVLEVAADGMEALFKPNGKAGAMKLQVRADADLGEGVKEILGEIEVEVLAGEATVIELAAEAIDPVVEPAPEEPVPTT